MKAIVCVYWHVGSAESLALQTDNHAFSSLLQAVGSITDYYNTAEMAMRYRTAAYF